MGKILDYLGECLEAFSEAYKYAELDFFKLKGEVISLIDRARSKGYDLPSYCELAISIISPYQTDVTIQAIYKKDGKFFRFKKTIDVGKLVHIPQTINSRLLAEHKVTIKLEDYANLYAVKESEIAPEVNFKALQSFTFKNVSDVPTKKEIMIQDELFYYTVSASYIFDDKPKKTSRKYYAVINNMPDDVYSAIADSEEHECTIDVS